MNEPAGRRRSQEAMHRFYLPPADCGGEHFTLAGAEAHHALRVLRVQDGERVTQCMTVLLRPESLRHWSGSAISSFN